MRIATLTLPDSDNTGQSLSDIHALLRLDMVENFGGFTAIPGNGGWQNDAGKLFFEPVTVYHVAMDETEENAQRWRMLARHAATMGAQESVFITQANGMVEFVTGYSPLDELQESVTNEGELTV